MICWPGGAKSEGRGERGERSAGAGRVGSLSRGESGVETLDWPLRPIEMAKAHFSVMDRFAKMSWRILDESAGRSSSPVCRLAGGWMGPGAGAWEASCGRSALS